MRRLTQIAFILFLHVCSMSAAGQESYRDRWHQPERIMDSVRVIPGMIVGEVGAGDGYLTFKLSRRVKPGGFVYANDIVERGLRRIREQCEQDDVENIQTVMGQVDDPRFPVDTLDLVIMDYVFHEISHPVAFLNRLPDYMNPDAQLVIIDRDPDKYGGDSDHFLKKDRVNALLESSTFEVERILTFLERDFVFMCRQPDPVAGP